MSLIDCLPWHTWVYPASYFPVEKSECGGTCAVISSETRREHHGGSLSSRTDRVPLGCPCSLLWARRRRGCRKPPAGTSLPPVPREGAGKGSSDQGELVTFQTVPRGVFLRLVSSHLHQKAQPAQLVPGHACACPSERPDAQERAVRWPGPRPGSPADSRGAGKQRPVPLPSSVGLVMIIAPCHGLMGSQRDGVQG